MVAMPVPHPVRARRAVAIQEACARRGGFRRRKVLIGGVLETPKSTGWANPSQQKFQRVSDGVSKPKSKRRSRRAPLGKSRVESTLSSFRAAALDRRTLDGRSSSECYASVPKVNRSVDEKFCADSRKPLTS